MAESWFGQWVARATSPGAAATCRRNSRRDGSPPAQASGLCHPVPNFQTGSAGAGLACAFFCREISVDLTGVWAFSRTTNLLMPALRTSRLRWSGGRTGGWLTFPLKSGKSAGASGSWADEEWVASVRSGLGSGELEHEVEQSAIGFDR